MDDTEIAFDERGLVPCIVQDWRTGEVLMLAYMNDQAWERTLRTGQAWFWSRSRAQLWEKGATSGNRMAVIEVRLDCDEDSLLLRVHPDGPACHTGEHACFFNVVETQRG